MIARSFPSGARPAYWTLMALAIVAVALPATADAPRFPPQYEPFDRETAEITDAFTGLVWERRIGKTRRTVAVGQAYCPVVLGRNGRLPTVKELLTLVDEQPHQEYDTSFSPPIVLKSIDQLAFKDTPTNVPYWTSTPAGSGKFWTVEFTSGKTAPMLETEQLSVRCVR